MELPLELDLHEQRAIVLAVGPEPTGWVDADRLSRKVLGGGPGGYRGARQILDHLERANLIERRTIGGRRFYRRTDVGLQLACEALQADDDGLLAEAAADGGIGVWTPAPGDPSTLEELVGQAAVKHQLRQNIEFSRRTGKPLKGMLLIGASGCGKTLAASLASAESQLRFLHISMADTDPDDLEEILELACEGAVVLLDELQAARPRLRDALLVALDPSRELPFTPLAATTDPGQIPERVRRRFPIRVTFEAYTLGEATILAARRAERLGIPLAPRVPEMIARAARCSAAGVARLVAEAEMIVDGTGRELTVEGFAEHLEQTNRDERGIDVVEREILVFARDEAGGKGVGVARIASTLGLDQAYVRERVSALSRERLLRSGGTAGHSITTEGREYLRQQY
jgi:Holliday junction resolvasome RuvABC ATP-dependent DNA helicase subunit